LIRVKIGGRNLIRNEQQWAVKIGGRPGRPGSVAQLVSGVCAGPRTWIEDLVRHVWRRTKSLSSSN